MDADSSAIWFSLTDSFPPAVVVMATAMVTSGCHGYSGGSGGRSGDGGTPHNNIVTSIVAPGASNCHWTATSLRKKLPQPDIHKTTTDETTAPVVSLQQPTSLEYQSANVTANTQHR